MNTGENESSWASWEEYQDAWGEADSACNTGSSGHAASVPARHLWAMSLRQAKKIVPCKHALVEPAAQMNSPSGLVASRQGLSVFALLPGGRDEEEHTGNEMLDL